MPLKQSPNRSSSRYLGNAAWMFLEQGVRALSGIVVGVYVARHLGPTNFGQLNYALAVTSIFLALAKLGFDSILVKDLINHPNDKQEYISTAFLLMLVAATCCVVAIFGLSFFIESHLRQRMYIWAISVGLLFQTFLVIDYNFQAEVKAKYSSIAKICALSLSIIVKYWLVWTNAKLFWFAASYTFDQVMIALFLLIFHIHFRQPNFLRGFKYTLVGPLLNTSWPMVVSGIAGIILSRIDQIMIKYFLGSQSLGIYSAGAKAFEGWSIITYVFSISMLPLITAAKSQPPEVYKQKLITLFRMAFWPSMAIAIFSAIASRQIILITFGSDYLGAGKVLSIMMSAAALSAFGFMSARFLIVEGMQKKIAKRNWLAVLINVPLNLLLIPAMGIEGAATATLLSLVVVHYAIDYFDPELKPLIRIKNRALLPILK